MRALAYTRLSQADALPDGTLDPEAVERQGRAIDAYCARQGWEIVERIVDLDYSASDYADRDRPGWARVLRMMQNREVDVVVGYHTDRLTRSPSALERLIRHVDATGVGVVATDGMLDLTSPSGKQVARMSVVFAAAESDATSRRVKAQRADRARRGLPFRSRPGFGWNADGTPVPEEAEAIVSAARAALAGASLESIARQWQQQGLRRRQSSAPWRGYHVRNVLMNPRQRGRSVYNGEDVGPLADGAPVLLPPEIAEPLMQLLSDSTRGVGTPRRRAMLTGLCRCGRCGSVMVRSSAGERRMWTCKKSAGGCGGVSLVAPPLETAVGEAILAALGDPERAPGPDPSQSATYAELAVLADREAALGGAYATGALPMKAFLAATRGIEEQRAVLLASLTPSRRAATLDRWGGIDGLRAAWADMASDDQNAVARLVIDAVTIQPAGALRGLDRASITWAR